MNTFDILLIEKYFLIVFLIFVTGIAGVLLNRHNIIILLLSFEILYLCSTLVFVFYAYESGNLLGLFYIIYIITIIGAEACISLAIVSFYYNVAKELNINELSWIKI